jgi:3D (Asp-Asp-Asp) domain-containing protein
MAVEMFRGPDHIAMRTGLWLVIGRHPNATTKMNEMEFNSLRANGPCSFESQEKMLCEAFAPGARELRQGIAGPKMRRFVIAVGLILLCGPAAFAREQSMLARVTVYWAGGGGGSDHWTRQHRCATGARLRAGHCAVDPRRIPYGSKITLPDGPLLAVDTGSAVVSRKAARRSGRTAQERSALVIDRFFETKQQALSWANRNPYFMLVQVSPPDFRSLQIPPARKTPQVIPQDIGPQAIPPKSESVRSSRQDMRYGPKAYTRTP